MSENKQKDNAQLDFSSIGGKKVGQHPVPVKGAKAVDFSSIGGKCILRSPLWAETKPAESVEKKDDVRE